MNFSVDERTVQLPAAEFRFGGVRLGMLDESAALETKTRFHETEDGLCVSGKAVKTLPFGCEYEIVRTWERTSGILRIAVDVRALHGGVIRDCLLDSLTVTGSNIQTAVLRDDGTLDNTLTTGGEMPRAVEFRLPDGSRAELLAGDDLWRHRLARKLGAESCWCLTAEKNNVLFERTMVHFPEETEPVQRPWRWEYLFVWGRPDSGFQVSGDTERVDASNLCFASPAVQRKFRELVRQSRKSLRLTGAALRLCTDAGHTGRGESLPHQDTGALLSFYLWANKILRKRNQSFTVELDEKTAETRPALQAVLGAPPAEGNENGLE